MPADLVLNNFIFVIKQLNNYKARYKNGSNFNNSNNFCLIFIFWIITHWYVDSNGWY